MLTSATHRHPNYDIRLTGVLQGFPGRGNCREVAGGRWNTRAPQQHSVPLHNPVVATSVYKCWRNSFNTDSQQKIGIEFAGFCKFDNSFGDSFIDKITSVTKLKSRASHFECDGHDPLGLGIEFGTVQKLRDGHDPRRYLQWLLLCKSRV